MENKVKIKIVLTFTTLPTHVENLVQIFRGKMQKKKSEAGRSDCSRSYCSALERTLRSIAHVTTQILNPPLVTLKSVRNLNVVTPKPSVPKVAGALHPQNFVPSISRESQLQ